MKRTPNWAAIDTVLLDMDGTLLDLAFDNDFWQRRVPLAYGAANGLGELDALAVIEKWIARHQGTLNWYCLDFWSHELKLDIAALKAEAAAGIGYRPGAEAFLQQLHASPRQVVMVTNAHRDALNLKVARTGLDRYFDVLVSSHDYRHPKEEQAFWQQLQRQHPFDPQRTLFVDDSLPVLASAAEYGIGHLWSILHPDSSQPARNDTDPFPYIDRFDDVMPHD
ncbi:GMP/IMP nucleotidase [Isoalcanivorax beigongshangi]|uniref:GMP/IMP nucleotidase n=1 Tax=Isoalcanivorax beigongshangi TaxID=3238810 RepID=A0ABV4AM49_9GAMM